MTLPDPLPRGLDAVDWWSEHLRDWEFVYIIQGDEGTPVKIGRAIDVRARLKGLQTGNPQELRVLAATPGAAYDEAEFHRHLKFSRVRGEWFEGPMVDVFLDWFHRLSDHRILRYAVDHKPPYADYTLPIPDLKPKGGRDVSKVTVFGHKWRTKSKSSPVSVRRIEPSPLTEEESREHEVRYYDGRKRRPDPAEYGWDQAA